MFTLPEKMPDESRIWIYQASREFTGDEEIKISTLTKEFLENWTAHNQELKASFEIRYHIFLILMIDSSHALASGCSIDKSIHFIQKLEKEFSISLLDRQIYALRIDDKINLVSRKNFDKLIGKEISDSTLIFNNLIKFKRELVTSWEIPIRESWHGAISGIRN